jgi:hypothetical protein
MSRIVRRVHQPSVYFVTTQTWHRRELFRKAALASFQVRLVGVADSGGGGFLRHAIARLSVAEPSRTVRPAPLPIS